MATTTNFGWETPDDTDLVKDGALAMRTLGNSIDTSFVDLKGGTTGQNLRKNSNTDLDFTWAGDATNTVIDAAGDLLYGTAADTLGRIAIGTTGQVLTVAGGIPSWATPSVSSSGLTLITTTTLSASGSFNITSCFSSTYDDYIIFMDEIVGSTTSYFNYGLRTGTTNSTANYKFVNYAYTYAGSNGSSNNTGDSSMGALDWTTTNADAGSIILTLRGPFLTKATQNSIEKSQHTGASMQNGLHAVATSYDSMWFTVNSGTVSGKIRIYGLAK